MNIPHVVWSNERINCLYLHDTQSKYYRLSRHRETETARQTVRRTETETETERETHTHRERDRGRETEIHRQRQRRIYIYIYIYIYITLAKKTMQGKKCQYIELNTLCFLSLKTVKTASLYRRNTDTLSSLLSPSSFSSGFFPEMIQTKLPDKAKIHLGCYDRINLELAGCWQKPNILKHT